MLAERYVASSMVEAVTMMPCETRIALLAPPIF